MNGDWAYIGRTTKSEKRFPEVGTIVCVAIDDPKWSRDTAKDVAKWIRSGLTVERVPTEWVKQYLRTAERYIPEDAATHENSGKGDR